MLKWTYGHKTYGRRHTEGWRRKQQVAPAKAEVTSLNWIRVELNLEWWLWTGST